MRKIDSDLIEAIRKEEISKVCALVRKGANLNQMNEYGDPLLHVVIIQGNRNLFETLLLLGADVNQQDLHGVSPLSRAIKHNRLKMMRRLLAEENLIVNNKDKNGLTPLHFAAGAGLCLNDLKSLIVSGLDVNETNKWGDTALFFAACPLTVQNLLSLGASYDIKNRWGQTAYEYFYQQSKKKNTTPLRKLRYHQMAVQLQKREGLDQFISQLQPHYASQLKRVGFLKYKKILWQNARG